MKNNIYDCLILGAGPAGLSAALYCARSNLKVALIDSFAIGGAPGNYCEIENYLGFKKIQGFELCEKFEEHIDEFNVEKFPYEEIKEVDLTSDIKKIKTQEREFSAKTVIIATGAKPKKLGIKGETENIGKGVSYCAVCDGAFYQDKIVTVIGGGNSALEEALYLTKFAKKVYLIHRRNDFRADEIVKERVKKNKKITLILDTIPIEIIANNKVEEIVIKNIKTEEEKKLKTDGVFPYIGIEPNSDLFFKQIKTDESGFILTDETMQTNLKGVYAIGDVRKTPLRQVITAVSDGAVAGVSSGKYIMKLKEETTKV